tara:strand:+ start:5264 stop:5983 length:720 start_codon:yes stop_codon:yes gene_type:complete
MAAKTESKSQTKINSLLGEQGEFAVDEARGIYDQMKGSRPSTYVGISPERQQALDFITNMAQNGGTGVAGTALDEYNKTMSGGYMNANPYLDDIVNRAVGAAAGSQTSGYAGGGRFGSGAMANAQADAMQQTASSLYGANYQQERDRMMGMLDRSGTIDDMQYQDARNLSAVGQQYETDQANQNQEAMNVYNQDAQTLSTFLSMLGQNPLMGEVTTTMSGSSIDPMAIASGAAGALGSI